jgi:hypothetical protein
MPKYWLISDRNNNGTGTGLNNNGLSYFVSDAGPLNNIANWRRVAPGPLGNYVLQKAMAAAWTRKNQPLLVSLINQLLMVAADVDNDLFDAGAPDNDDGAAMVNLTYRITALYSGRDEVLGASAGLKHFGTRRLGRSGLAHRPPAVIAPPATDNVWDVDCSSFFPSSDSGIDIHGAYFVTDTTVTLIRKILSGIDRNVLVSTGATTGSAWPQK